MSLRTMATGPGPQACWDRKNRTGCNELRENAIVSPKRATIDEKMESSCRSTHCPTRKRNLLVGTRPLRRENGIFLSEHALAVEKKLSSVGDRELKTCTHREFNSDYRAAS